MKRRHFFARIAAALAAPAAVPCTAIVSAAPLHEIMDDGPAMLPSMADIPPWLKHWRSLPRQPIWESADATTAHLIRAAEQSQSVRLTYHAGSRPGQPRLFTPALLFRTAEGADAPIYVTGWCHQREGHRTLRLDQITLELPVLL